MEDPLSEVHCNFVHYYNHYELYIVRKKKGDRIFTRIGMQVDTSY